MESLEEALGYTFEERALLERALTHRSYANEKSDVSSDNQRLEFLGDSVLGLVIAHLLFEDDQQAAEGTLSSRQSDLVCEGALVERADALCLGEHLRLGRGEVLTGGRQKPGLLADAYEAVLAAVYLDGGYEAARGVIARQHGPIIASGGPEQPLAAVVSEGGQKSPTDFKSYLQREVQRQCDEHPRYVIISVEGPDHARTFVAEVHVDQVALGRGQGGSKKQAQQEAARQAVERLADVGGDLSQLLFDPLPSPGRSG
ncbi:ribonuclease III [Lujinxingia litoralis]|uniref:Ribonuclease 3 n=1 Tax=Lujinxingia litoralis TaxID=2211119 RepID=A0A328CEG1_9DELT|nr:ribonuclease III [Lujinxingia litoralis]